MRRTCTLVTGAALCLLASSSARADEIRYSVLQSDGLPPDSLRIAQDGTPTIKLANAEPGRTYTFTVSATVETKAPSTEFPTPPIPVSPQPLTTTDAPLAITSNPTAISFDAPGKPVTFNVQVTVPPLGSAVALSRIALQTPGSAGTSATCVARLSTTGGVVLAVSTGTAGASGSFLTDTTFQSIATVYSGSFKVLTKGQTVSSTNPGSFYRNVMVMTPATAGPVKITLSALPKDFVPWGANSLHAYVGPVNPSDPEGSGTGIALGNSLAFELANAPAYETILLTFHMQYRPSAIADWATYLPRVYTFGATFEAGGATATSSASMTAVRKR